MSFGRLSDEGTPADIKESGHSFARCYAAPLQVSWQKLYRRAVIDAQSARHLLRALSTTRDRFAT
jgi:hypothetical protein